MNDNENQDMVHAIDSATALLFGRQHEPGRHGFESMLLYLHAACFSESAGHLKNEDKNNNIGVVKIRDNMCMMEYTLLIFRINNLPLLLSEDKRQNWRCSQERKAADAVGEIQGLS